MAYALGNHTIARSGIGDNVTSGAIDTTGADLIIVHVAGLPSVTLTLSDSQSNSWTALTKNSGVGNFGGQIYYKQAPTTNASHTFTISSTGGFPSVVVAAFSGSVATPFDVENQNTTGFGTSVQVGSVTPGQANSLIISSITFSSNETHSIDSSFTVTDQQGNTGNGLGCGLAYLIQGAASAVNPTWSWASGSSGVALDAVFKPGAASSGAGRLVGGNLVGGSLVRSLA